MGRGPGTAEQGNRREKFCLKTTLYGSRTGDRGKNCCGGVQKGGKVFLVQNGRRRGKGDTVTDLNV
jgi:hypothetical protein